MSPRRRDLLAGAVAASGLAASGASATARFQPSWESLAAGYRTPDWFRDAKLGLWAHWGPQCVPEFGDWYGRKMYIQGDPFYEHHLKTYGHPSKTGFIDIIGQWKAERWDPEGLIRLYKGAGARYFVAMAQHHDNFDCFASSHHCWNSVNVGPKKDIVGTWAKLCRKHGLRFGVSNHGAHAWHWWQTAYGYDAEGPMKGQRYDAYRLRRADGAGKYWAGLDPQELYTGAYPTMVPPDGVDSARAMDAWNARSREWTEEPPALNPEFTANWLARCKELTDKYQPDLVYFDDTGLPLGQAGLDAVAHYYNANAAQHGGRLEAVVTGKKLTELQRRGIVETVERGFSDHLRAEPWQTDTCIGDWHYNRQRFVDHSYVPAKAVIQRLLDVVSKNGNLLLSIPVRGDGSIDADEHRIVEEIGAWMAVNGEGIYASRPWKIYGEGPTNPAAGMMNEGKAKPFEARDIRFTTRAGALYAAALDWPQDGVVRIESLGEDAKLAPGAITRVDLVGGGELKARRTGEALEVTLPERRPTAFAPMLRIRGQGLV